MQKIKCKKHCHGCGICEFCMVNKNLEKVMSLKELNMKLDLFGKIYGYKPHEI